MGWRKRANGQEKESERDEMRVERERERARKREARAREREIERGERGLAQLGKRWGECVGFRSGRIHGQLG